MYLRKSLTTTALFALAFAAPQRLQEPLQVSSNTVASSETKRPLHGRFLHITDFHPDRFYQVYSSTAEDAACHRGDGPAGVYGAETSECDSPISLINETFAWIEKEYRDSVDFVIWTGDSARHDNDEELPRSAEQVIGLNEFMVNKMFETFGKRDGDELDEDPNNDFVVPVIPTFGNNDVLPHNVMTKGPNTWLRTYARVWRQFIPEPQKHQFEQGGWFYTEVIPHRLAGSSLNTLYFFSSNAAADGCAIKSEPGYHQMEWLRIQLQFLRERGMKAILTGHVPPVRQPAKSLWDETCWQKYSLWLKQYRDVVIAGMYGHFNYDHFILQDFDDIEEDTKNGRMEAMRSARSDDRDVHAELSSDYWVQLRNEWSEIPTPPKSLDSAEIGNLVDWSLTSIYRHAIEILHKPKDKERERRKKEEKYLRKVGGRYAERFASTYVSASVVPNLYPAIRVFEYNITDFRTHSSPRPIDHSRWKFNPQQQDDVDSDVSIRKAKKDKRVKFIVPDPPSKSAPPGPAYSPQLFSLIKYTQYLANLTHINNDFHSPQDTVSEDPELGLYKWKEGKHKGKKPQGKNREPNPRKFKFEQHYDTQDDEIYQLKDLTISSLLDLARRIGAFRADSQVAGSYEFDEASDEHASMDKQKDKKKDKKKKKKRKHGRKGHPDRNVNKPWYTFVRRAFVETKDPGDLWEEFDR